MTTSTQEVIVVNPAATSVVVVSPPSGSSTTSTTVTVSGTSIGPQGTSGVISVTSPITNTGTSTAANIGINQSALSITATQVTGTAISFVQGNNIQLSTTAVALGGSITITSSGGVTSLAGTTNQVSVSSSTGAVTLSLPQDINSTASPTFNIVRPSSLIAQSNAFNFSSTISSASSFTAQGVNTNIALSVKQAAANTAYTISAVTVGTGSPVAVGYVMYSLSTSPGATIPSGTVVTITGVSGATTGSFNGNLTVYSSFSTTSNIVIANTATGTPSLSSATLTVTSTPSSNLASFINNSGTTIASITSTGAVNATTVNCATVNGTTVNGTTVNATTVNATTVNGTTVNVGSGAGTLGTLKLYSSVTGNGGTTLQSALAVSGSPNTLKLPTVTGNLIADTAANFPNVVTFKPTGTIITGITGYTTAGPGSTIITVTSTSGLYIGANITAYNGASYLWGPFSVTGISGGGNFVTFGSSGIGSYVSGSTLQWTGTTASNLLQAQDPLGNNVATISTTGAIVASSFSGDGSGLSSISAGAITGGTLSYPAQVNAIAVKGSVTQVTATYTVDSLGYDDLIKINNAATAVITLPTASSYPGRVLKFIHQNAISCSAPAGSVVPLNSATAGTALFSSATTAGKWTYLMSDGTNWLVIAQN